MRILLGVPGGIAAYKAVELARLAVKAGHSVRVIQTPASLRFVGRASFAAITGAPVLASEFEDDPAKGAWPGEEPGSHTPISHLALIERADVYVVAPATANTLSRLASGSADDLVSTSALAATCPVVLAPAMNGLMWANPATVENVLTLKDRGFHVLEPEEGPLASHGEAGKGRLVEPDVILHSVEMLGAQTRDLDGVAVVVTAGGTREPIDGVRFIGNRSSGRMGFAVAEAAQQRGALVTLIAANSSLPCPLGVELVEVGSAAQLAAATETAFQAADVLVMAAAVADFRPVAPVGGKIDKSAGVPSLQLEPVDDILKGLAAKKSSGQVLVGFAAEHGPSTQRARGKLEAKDLDMVVYNDISDGTIGFDSLDNQVTLITHKGERQLALASKQVIAGGIIDALVELRSSGS
ncbi:MAG: bifunctional phosphopantothenoylcysteine decarboxylase/phosphopantothenate--cysteine ligase CoaBC [Actinobacteria bacterium]|uniref:Unannotated protein n=1 Tax=freshwater metagenome TaxID=449393 RepID=A0A6J7EIG3_9ZZZZ|nr:bifunctional phosphopantothenoylcysteine decarboxylase/phosphopantothenate--cysteine ligase CoaBC [Actinomycetota bacterium]